MSGASIAQVPPVHDIKANQVRNCRQLQEHGLPEASGERTGAMYRLIGSTLLNGLAPEVYLRYVLERIAGHPINRIAEMLLRNVQLAGTLVAVRTK